MTTTVSGSSITFNDNTTQNTSAYGGGFAFRNRIINGGMVIDQRNAGASVTITNTDNNTYTLDRWAAYGSAASKFSVQQDAAAVTPPVGFNDYLGVTSLSAYSITSGDLFRISQFIEGYNIADLAWGTANAQTVTLSFWVRSSLTGTFGGAISNSAYNRGYPFSYTISSANTWEYKTLTITGDTTGTWLTTNGMGMRVNFSLGTGSTNSGTAGAWQANGMVSATGAVSVVGTNGATWYVTGVQLEKGSTATSFDYRPYGTELALCQRYYQQQYTFNGYANNTTTIQASAPCPVAMRATPTLSAGGALTVTDGAANYTQSSLSITGVQGTTNGVTFNAGNFTGLTTYRPCMNNGTASAVGSLAYSSEL